MIGDLLRDFELAAVLQIRGDACGAKSVVADFRFDVGGGRAALDDAVGVLLPERFAAENVGVSSRRLEERLIWIAGDAGGGDICVEQLVLPNCGGKALRALCRPFRVSGPSRGALGRSNHSPSFGSRR